MRITDIRFTLVCVELESPFAPIVWARGEFSHVQSIIIELRTDEGLVGWGETWAPRSMATGTALLLASPASTQALAEELSRLLGDEEIAINRAIELLQHHGVPNLLIAGVEMALWDLLGKASGKALCDLLGGASSSQIPLAACIGIQTPDALARSVEMLLEQGYRTIKVKGGREPAEDVATARTMREMAGPEIHLRLDVNANYPPGIARQLSRQLEPFGLQYLEQPCHREAWGAMAVLRQATATPIAINESLITTRDMLHAVTTGAADVGVVDIWGGGIREVCKIAAIAEAAGIPLAMHCGGDLGIKSAALLHMTAALSAFTYASDSLYYAQGGDILREPLQIVNGQMALPRGAGLGVEIDRTLLEKYRV